MTKTITKYILTTFLIVMSLSTAFASEQKTALVLSGGGARAFAHIGVLKALEEKGWYPDMIVGTSMGAIIGAMYSCGLNSEEIYSYLKKTKWEEILTKKRYRDIETISKKTVEIPSIFTLKIDCEFNIHYPKYILSTQGIVEKINRVAMGPQYYSGGNFDSLAIPLRIVATNIKTGKPVVFKEGNIAKLLSGSAAYPIVLSPVEHDTMLLIDGGLTNNVPCDVAREEGCDFIIAVNMSSKISDKESLTTTSYMDQMINTLSFYSDTRNLYLADVLITPMIGEIYSTDFDSIDVLVELGYREAKLQLENLEINTNKPDTNYLKKAVNRLKSKTVRDIYFVNKGITKSHVLRRELEIKKNKPFNLKNARRSIANIYSTGIFNNVDLDIKEGGPDSVDLAINLIEKPGGVLNFSANYNNEVNTSSLMSYKMMNLFGAGVINNLSLLFNDYNQKISLDFISPRIFETILTNSMNVYMWKKFYPLYHKGDEVTANRVKRTGLTGNIGIQIKRVGLTSIGIKQEYFDVEENNNEHFKIKSSRYNITRIVAKIAVDNTDDYDLPTRGNKNIIVYEHSINNENLEPYLKLSVTTSNYETYNQTTYSTFLKFGYLSKSNYYFDKFSIGGQNSFPGMHRYENWGNMIFVTGMELRFPLTKGIYSTLKMKVGNVWDELDNFNLTDFNWGAQVGLIVPTPIGPIRAEYSGNIEQQYMFYFSIGHNF